MANQIYRLPLIVRRLYVGLAAGMVVLGAGTYVVVPPSLAADWLARFIINGMIAASLLSGLGIVAYVHRVRLEVTQEWLLFRGLIRSRELRLSDITGWRIRQYLEIHTADGIFAIARSLAYVEEFRTWLERYPNLDDQTQDAELAEIRREAPEPLLDAETLAKLERAERVSRRLELGSIALFLWVLFYPVPLLPLLWATALLPWLSLLYIGRQDGFVQIAGKEGQLRPMLFCSVMLPGCALALRAMLDAQFATFDHRHALLIGAVNAALFVAALWADPSARRPVNAVCLLVLLSGYGGGAVALGNALLDDTVTTFRTQSARRDAKCFQDYPGAFGLAWRNPVPCVTKTGR